MKILTKEEEEAHYAATLKGGIGGGIAGIAVGVAAVYGATLRYPAFRSLTLPLKAFLVTGAGTFSGIVSADKYSRAFEKSRHAEENYQDQAERQRQEAEARKSAFQKMMDWGRENRYPIVGGSWVASMVIALSLVGRSPHLSTQQKIVQARVYAQGLTLAVLVATAAFEIGDKGKGEGRWETVQIVDPNDPTHKHLIDKKIHHERYAGEDQWRDMVEAEERKLKEREAAAKEEEEKHAKAGSGKGKKHAENKGGDHKKSGGADKEDKKHDAEGGEKKPSVRG